MPTNPQHDPTHLLAKVRDYLVSRLREGAMDIPEAADIAQATLQLFPEGLTDDQFKAAAKQLEETYPNHYALFHAAQLEYEMTEARKVLDQGVLTDIASGNLDAALDKLNQVNLK